MKKDEIKNDVKMSWIYDYPLTKRFDWIVTCFILVLITDAIIALAFFLAGPDNFLSNIKTFSFIFWMVFGIYFLACVITMLVHKGGYTYLYQITGNELIITETPLGSIGINHEMTVNKRIGNHVDLKRISKLTLNKSRNLIKIKGTLTLTTVYAFDNEINEVWNTLAGLCPEAKQIIK